MDQILKQIQNAHQEQGDMSNSLIASNALRKLETLNARFNKLEALTKKIFKEQVKEQEDIESEAKDRFAYFIEEAISRFNPEYDRPADEPDDLDGSDPRDRKIMESMTNMAKEYLDTIVEYESSDESSDEEMEEGEDSSEESEEESEEGSTDGSGENSEEEEEVDPVAL